MGDKPAIVNVDVGGIVALDGEAELELARQVGVAVERLGFALQRGRRRAVQPDFGVGPGVRLKTAVQQTGVFIQPLALGRLERLGGRDHVAHHVAASGKGRQAGAVDRPDAVAQRPFADVVVLQAAARGDAQGAVAGRVRQSVERQVLTRRDNSARQANPDHEAVGFHRLLLAPVAVVLLIRAVELEQRRGGFGNRGVLVREFGGDGAAQMIARALQFLRGRRLGGRRCDGGRGFRLWHGELTPSSRLHWSFHPPQNQMARRSICLPVTSAVLQYFQLQYHSRPLTGRRINPGCRRP